MQYTLDQQACRNLTVSMKREWLLTNGIGGYASGTASGINTRRYHGLLIAATQPPAGRMALLAAVDATVQSDGHPVGISANAYPGAIYPEGFHYLNEFSVGNSAVWRYRAGPVEIERRVTMHPNENAVTIVHRNTGKRSCILTLRPLVLHRDHHENFGEHPGYPSRTDFLANTTVLQHHGIDLYLNHPSAQRTPVQGWYYRFEHARESERGLNSRDDLYCPCELRYELRPGEEATIVAATQPDAMPYRIDEAPATFARLTPLLQHAAARFFVQTERRTSIIAGYPWFTDWGRDTMISLPGLCLHTGRIAEARQIILDYAQSMHKGLIPNRFNESGEGVDTNTVDATLWMVNAIHKTLQADWDEDFAKQIMPVLDEIFRWHMGGTDFGIQVDPLDGLLTQGQAGVQLTWMDAKIGDWVVTPRHGKPVEINGLWINACFVMAEVATRLGLPALSYLDAAEKGRNSFEAKFWHEQLGYYLDTADPADASLRPNQVIAMAVPFSPCDPDHARRALAVVGRELLTPNGLRTLGPNDANYRGAFRGPLPELDAAYHQGTVWPWLFGPYVTALVKFTGDRREAKRILRKGKEMLMEYGLAGIAEVYDGDEPQNPGGCPWQAWSVGEMLRAWQEDCGGD
ncbi:MAG: amylo-alpha-1,6-glucosidase [Fimbriimonas sp.]